MGTPHFVWPFTLGLFFISVFLLIKAGWWISQLPKPDRQMIRHGLLTRKTLSAFRETFREALLHRRIFQKNAVLGYMHMSLAFGWFLLIVVGHFETMLHERTLAFPVWKAIFFRYANPEPAAGVLFRGMAAGMDLLLLFVLSGVALAYYKRVNSRIFGMKKTTRLKAGDRVALSALWLIFPLRLVAESTSAGLHRNGSFLTQPAGDFLANAFPVEMLEQPAWWAYSCALGVFFLAMPVSRYMHIPVEVLLIFLRQYGVRARRSLNGYTRVQVYSCSRCGICLDSCQMTPAHIRNTQSVYVLKQMRGRRLNDEQLFNCLLCGRCQNDCPVGLSLNDLRITQRIAATREYNSGYEFLQSDQGGIEKSVDVIYYAGCMTHLAPAILKAMRALLDEAGVNWWFMDEEKNVCCGRPLMQAGQYAAARKLVAHNRDKILQSGAKTLVLSCPICYKVFNEDYNLEGIRVVHHSEYLLGLLAEGRLHPRKLPLRALYHDPCELGRGSGIYHQPRLLLDECAGLLHTPNEKEQAWCCGGSLGNIKIPMSARDDIRNRALEEYISHQPDVLVTACPLCKKTFAKSHELPVHDLAEVLYMAVRQEKINTPERDSTPELSYEAIFR